MSKFLPHIPPLTLHGWLKQINKDFGKSDKDGHYRKRDIWRFDDNEKSINTTLQKVRSLLTRRKQTISQLKKVQTELKNWKAQLAKCPNIKQLEQKLQKKQQLAEQLKGRGTGKNCQQIKNEINKTRATIKDLQKERVECERTLEDLAAGIKYAYQKKLKETQEKKLEETREKLTKAGQALEGLEKEYVHCLSDEALTQEYTTQTLDDLRTHKEKWEKKLRQLDEKQMRRVIKEGGIDPDEVTLLEKPSPDARHTLKLSQFTRTLQFKSKKTLEDFRKTYVKRIRIFDGESTVMPRRDFWWKSDFDKWQGQLCDAEGEAGPARDRGVEGSRGTTRAC